MARYLLLDPNGPSATVGIFSPLSSTIGAVGFGPLSTAYTPWSLLKYWAFPTYEVCPSFKLVISYSLYAFVYNRNLLFFTHCLFPSPCACQILPNIPLSNSSGHDHFYPNSCYLSLMVVFFNLTKKKEIVFLKDLNITRKHEEGGRVARNIHLKSL